MAAEPQDTENIQTVVPIRPGVEYGQGGNPPGSGGMEARITSLENDVKEIKSDVKSLSKNFSEASKELAEIKGMLTSLPSAESFGHLRGRIDSLPTTAKMAVLLTMAVAVMTIVTKGSEIAIMFRI